MGKAKRLDLRLHPDVEAKLIALEHDARAIFGWPVSRSDLVQGLILAATAGQVVGTSREYRFRALQSDPTKGKGGGEG